MAITQNTFTGDGSNLGPFSFTFKWLESTDIKVSVGGVLKTSGTHYNLQSLNYTTKTGGQVLFTAGNTPANGASIRIFRDTDDEALSAVFSSGSAIRARDLNDNFTQNLYVTQEVNNNAVTIDGSNPMVGNLNMNGYKILNLQSDPTFDTDAVNKNYVDTRVGASGPPGYTNWSYTAVGGETVVGTFGSVLEYQVGKEQVYINGALQKRNTGSTVTHDYVANDGNTITFYVPLIAGDIVMVRCVNYLAADPTASYNYSRWSKTIGVGGASSLGGTLPAQLGDGFAVLSYTPSREQVFVNGAMLQRGLDYTATNGTTISILGGALLQGDMVEVHSNNSI
jgi:hypothetical protein